MTNLPTNINFDLSQVKAVYQEGKHVIIELNNMKIKIYNSTFTSSEILALIAKGGNSNVENGFNSNEY